MDFRNKTLALFYNDERLVWEEFDTKLRNNRAGQPYKRDFMFDVGGKIAYGWAGVLDKGARADTGFSILHSDRVAQRHRSKLDANTIKMLKDGLLRVSLPMEQHAATADPD
jgi:hypothetical protein